MEFHGVASHRDGTDKTPPSEPCYSLLGTLMFFCRSWRRKSCMPCSLACLTLGGSAKTLLMVLGTSVWGEAGRRVGSDTSAMPGSPSSIHGLLFLATTVQLQGPAL